MSFLTIKNKLFSYKPAVTEVEITKLLSRIEEHLESSSFIPRTFDKEKTLKRFESASDDAPLSKKICGIKDLISNTEGPVSGGSGFLENYYPPFDATIYKALEQAGAINVLNANLDEFGFGGTGIHSYFGIVKNPVDETLISGGSSSGSGYLISKGLIDFSIVSDTGDSSRQPASHCGIFGFKPSFGMLSRYGFYPFCSGFDTPSIMSSSIELIAEVFSQISFYDPKDLSTKLTKKINYSELIKKPIKKSTRIAIFSDTFWKQQPKTKTSQKIENKFNDFIIDIKQKLGIRIDFYDFPVELLRLVPLMYTIISSVEGISNYMNMTGLIFPFEDKKDSVVFPKSTNGENYSQILFNNRAIFGSQFTFRQLMGSYFIDKENYQDIYIRSKKILSKINEEIDKLFREFDIVLSPTVDDIPSKIEDFKNNYSPSSIKSILILANFCSLPAISIPWETINDLPVGLHVMSSRRNDGFLLNFVNQLMKL